MWQQIIYQGQRELEGMNEPINEQFQNEQLMLLHHNERPWFMNFANYLCTECMPYCLTYQGRKQFFVKVKHNMWKDLFVFNYCSNGLVRRYVLREETKAIFAYCHSMPCAEHHRPDRTTAKVSQGGFYGPTLFKDSREWVKACDICQRTG